MKWFLAFLFLSVSPVWAESAIATFAGGCFWCMEPPFDKVEGVEKTISGYIGGKEPNPSYKEVSSGATGHTEAVQIHYNSKKVSYEKLLEVYWRNVDPTDKHGQFVDRGSQYRPEIFYHSEKQRELAEVSKKKLEESERFKKPIVVEISKAGAFYPAEKYHQNYYKENPLRYRYYRYRSGRDQFLDEIWGKDRSN